MSSFSLNLNDDELKIAKENSNMTILVYNRGGENFEIQTVWEAYVTKRNTGLYMSLDGIEKYGVMMKLCNGEDVFVPVGTEENANDYLKDFFAKKQLDLTNVDVVSMFYENVNKNTKTE